MTPTFARNLNVLFVAAVTIVLLSAYGVQFGAGELPCPLCLMQRLAMSGVGVGAVLNVLFGVRPRNYAISLFSAMFGGVVAGRQILLHIAPGDPGFGAPLLGWHLYTWSFIAFVNIGLILCLMLWCDRQFEMPTRGKQTVALPPSWLVRVVLGMFLLVAVANVATTLLLCGLGECEGDPTRYLWWD